MLKVQELARQQLKDREQEKRNESLAGLTKYYGDALKHVLPRMGQDASDYPAYFSAVENLFVLYEVPKQVQSKLLIPLLNERSKTLLAKLAKDKLDDYAVVKDYLLREFKLTPQQYRDKYLHSPKEPGETILCTGAGFVIICRITIIGNKRKSFLAISRRLFGRLT